MRPLLLNLAVTLDGFIEGPNGEIDWCLTDEDYGLTPFLARCDAALMGRKSYEGMLAYDPNPWPDKRKYVFSRTLQEVIPNAEVVAGEVAVEVARLKAMPGRAIWLFGGADLIAQCLRARLVDELCLSIHPSCSVAAARSSCRACPARPCATSTHARTTAASCR